MPWYEQLTMIGCCSSGVIILVLALYFDAKDSALNWRAKYPDGALSVRMNRKQAHDYVSIFGGEVVEEHDHGTIYNRTGDDV